MSTEDRVAANQAKAANTAAISANNGIDPALTAQFGITDPDMAKYLAMAPMPVNMRFTDPAEGGSRGQESKARKDALKFEQMGGQAELDRLHAKVTSDPTLSSQLKALTAAGNKGDIVSKLGDAFVAATPYMLGALGAYYLAPLVVGAGGTGGAGGLVTGVTSEMEAAAAASAAASPGVAAANAAGNVATGLSYDMLGTAATGGMGSVAPSAFSNIVNQVVPKGGSTVPSTTIPNTKVPSTIPDWVTATGAMLPSVLNAINPTPTPGANTSTSQNVYSPEEQKQRDYMLAEARRVYDAAVAAEIVAGNPNAAVAPQSPDTIAAQNMLRQYATGAATAMTQEQQAAQTYGLTTAMDVNSNPYLQAAIDAAIRPVTQSYTDPNGVLSKIRGDAVQSGQYGGTRQGLGEGVAAGRYLQVVGDTAGKMASDAYNKGQDTFARTLQLSPTLVQAGQQPAQMLSAIGTQNEGYQQEVNNAAAQGKQWDLTKGFQPLQNFTNLVNANTNPVATSTAPPTPAPRKNLVGDAVSGAILANQIWGAFNK